MADRSPGLAERAVLSALASCCGATCSNPFDVVRARLQRRGGAFLFHLRELLFAPGGWRVGLSASLLREVTYSGTRISLYPTFKSLLSGNEVNTPSLPTLLLSGALAGALGAVIGNPPDLLKTRQMTCEVAAARSLRSLGSEAVSEGGGLLALWRGTWPSSQRAAVITAAQLGSYDATKSSLRAFGLKEGLGLHFASAGVAGFCATAASSPLDNVKTVFYTAAAGDKLRVAAVLLGLLKEGGVSRLFAGFLPAYLRLGIHSLVTLTTLEALRKACGLRPL